MRVRELQLGPFRANAAVQHVEASSAQPSVTVTAAWQHQQNPYHHKREPRHMKVLTGRAGREAEVHGATNHVEEPIQNTLVL